MKKLLFTALFVILLPLDAQADEFGEYLKFTCIPEIGYMELTSTISYDLLELEQAKELGLLVDNKNPSCEFQQYDTLVEFNLKRHICQTSPCVGSRWFDVTVVINGHELKTFEYFGNQTPIETGLEDGIRSAYAPHILSYQRFNYDYIHACTGKARRTCESFQFNPRELKPKDSE